MANRNGNEGARELTRETIRAIDQLGALYLVADGRCEEWQAHVESQRISLVRYWYPLPDESARRIRSRHSRTIHITTSGLALEASSEWAQEEFDKRKNDWRNVTGTVGSNLCVAEPAVRRVRRGLHYVIGGADVFLSRRVCEQQGGRVAGRAGFPCAAR